MSIDECIDTMKNIQASILEFLAIETNDLDDFYNLILDPFNEYKICEDKYKFISYLHLLSKISNNYHRGINFFTKMEKILQFIKKDIKNYLTNSEIFNIFKGNKRILLFLFNEKIIFMDEYIIQKITNMKYIFSNYPLYFLPEIKSLKNEKWLPKYDNELMKLTVEIMNDLPDNFEAKRKTGENDDYVCELIRNDSIEEFIAYTTKNNYPLESEINTNTIYETNPFLFKNKNKNANLIEYAAFFGSIQIFNYLRYNKVEMPPILWLYAIHGNNAEIIHHLEENDILPENRELIIELYKDCLKESIKCHHNDIFEYIKDNFLVSEKINLDNFNINYLKYYNFSFIDNKFNDEYSFYFLCKYDYSLIVNILLKDQNIDITKPIVYSNDIIKFLKVKY